MTRSHARALALAVVLLAGFPAAAQELKALVGGTLVDGFGGTPIRNSVVLLLSQQTYETLIEHEGKEALRVTVRDTIRSVLEESAGEPIVEDVYFSSFVMQ